MKWCLVFIFVFLFVLSLCKNLDIYKFKSKTATKFACKRTKCLEEKYFCGRLKNKISNKSMDDFIILLRTCDVEFMKCQGYQVEIIPLKNCQHQRKLTRNYDKTRVKRETESEEEEEDQESPESVVLTMPGDRESLETLKEKDESVLDDNKNVDHVTSHEKSEKESITDKEGEGNVDKTIAEENQLPETENNEPDNNNTGSNAASVEENKDIGSGDKKSSVENDAKDSKPESKENKILSSETEDEKDDKAESKPNEAGQSDHMDEQGENADNLKPDVNANVDNLNHPDETKDNSDKEQETEKKGVENIGFLVDYDLKEANEGVDFDEYHKDCPTQCPAREVMVCARCKDGVYRTFMSVCHLRMFNCKHPDEKAELVSRYPCVLSAPFLAEAPAPKGRVAEPGDKDLILHYIRCRENDELRDDPKCKFDDKKSENKF